MIYKEKKIHSYLSLESIKKLAKYKTSQIRNFILVMKTIDVLVESIINFSLKY